MKKGKAFLKILGALLVGFFLYFAMEVVFRLPKQIGKTGYYFVWGNELCYKDPDPLTGMISPNGLASVTTEEVYYNDYYLLAYDTNFKWYDILSVPKEGENYLIYIHHPYLDEASFYAAIDSLHIDIGKMKRVRTLRRVLSRSVDVPQISQE